VVIQQLGLSSIPAPPAAAAGRGLEIGQVSQPWNAPVAAAPTGDAAITAEVGATGTPIFGGFLRELGEYNSTMAWPAAYLVFEEMRRSDAHVASTLWASKLPIRGAEWKMQAPKNPTPIEQEATDFCEETMFDGDNDFDAMLENALLCLDFGAALQENVFKIDGNRVRLAKTAPRLPLTFYRWICDPGTDNLRTIEQLGYRAGQYVRTELPMERCTLFTFRQEGANFTGQSLLRQMYQHWYIKSGLYRVDAIACERNGMGIPVITMGAEWKAEDKLTALDWVGKLTAHQRTGLVLPPSWTFALEGVKGNLRDPKEAIQHHGTLITLVGLAQFMMMGQSGKASGNRSLGETMSDFFFMGLQATAKYIAQRINGSLVKQLCDYNFAGLTRYPKLVPQQIMALNFDAIVDALSKLGQGGIMTATPSLEAWVRERIGAPEADSATIVRERAKKTTSLPAAAPGAAAAGKTPADKTPAAEEEETPEEKVAGADVAGLNLRRAPRGAEKHLALSEIISGLDKGRADVAAALRGARPRVQAEVIHKLVDAPVRNMHRVSVAPDERLTADVEGILRGVHGFGHEQVTKERASQLAGHAPGDAAKIRMADAKRDQIGLYADGVVSKFTNNLTARAANAAVNRKRNAGDATKGDVIQGIGADLDDQSDKWIDGLAGEGANEAFADGRQAGYEQYKDEIGKVIYSALLDPMTCDPCGQADGDEGATPDDLQAVPNPDCDGGDKCRCVHVFVFSDEGTEEAA
jgi:phage gp29-like protein